MLLCALAHAVMGLTAQWHDHTQGQSFLSVVGLHGSSLGRGGARGQREPPVCCLGLNVQNQRPHCPGSSCHLLNVAIPDPREVPM